MEACVEENGCLPGASEVKLNPCCSSLGRRSLTYLPEEDKTISSPEKEK